MSTWRSRWWRASGRLAAGLLAVALAGPVPAAAVTVEVPAVVLDVSAGSWATCAVRQDGTIACWGEGVPGKPPDGTFTAVATGAEWACAIRSGGALVCWGNGSANVLTPPEGTFTQVAAAAWHACAIRTGGAIECWGESSSHRTDAPAGTYTAIAAGWDHTCAIRTDGTVACWGLDDAGETKAPTGTFVAIGATGERSCGIRPSGKLVCWPAQAVPAGSYTAVDLFWTGGCALTSAGALRCWGRDTDGRTTPPAGTYVRLSAGDGHACAIKADGTLACWGGDDGGRVTPAPIAMMEPLAPWQRTDVVELAWDGWPAMSPIASWDVRSQRILADGAYMPHARWKTGTNETTATFDGTPGTTYCFSVRAWDVDGHGSPWSPETCTVLAYDDSDLEPAGAWETLTGEPWTDGTALRSTQAGARLAVGDLAPIHLALIGTMCPECGSVNIVVDGDIVGTVSLAAPTRTDSRFIPLADWLEYDLEMGSFEIEVATDGKEVTVDGVLTTATEIAPGWTDGGVPVPTRTSSERDVAGIEAGGSGTCAIRPDGALACWGETESGTLVPPAGVVVDVDLGPYLACAVGQDGHIRCWGDDWNEAATAPTGVYTDVEVGSYASCAIRADGTLRCWGEGYEDGEGEVPAGTVAALDLHGALGCAIRTDGTLACWRPWGTLLTPPGGTFTDIGVGDDAACAIRTDGTIACWGSVALADPPAGDTYVDLAVGAFHACALRDDGSIACWGDDHYGQSDVPAGTFDSISAGDWHTCGVLATGGFACWGQDSRGAVTSAPGARMTVPGVVLSSPVGVSWAGASVAPVVAWDTRYQRSTSTGTTGEVTPWLTGTTETGGTLELVPGDAVCVQAQATDADGAIGPWAERACASMPLDDRTMTRSAGWDALKSSAYYQGTAVRTTRRGATLTSTRVKFVSVSLVATTCPTCGVVGVYLDGWRLRKVDLSAATTTHQVVIPIANLDWKARGRLEIKVLSSGKKVVIDGFAVRALR